MSSTPPPPPSALPATYQPAPPLSPQDQRTWATLTHLGGIFFGVFPALIVYLVAKDRGAFLREHSRQALNFQLTMLIAAVASGFVLVLTFWLIIPFLLPLAISVALLVFSILAAVKASAGELYAYPLTIPFVR